MRLAAGAVATTLPGVALSALFSSNRGLDGPATATSDDVRACALGAV
jgi:hypothetical protein